MPRKKRQEQEDKTAFYFILIVAGVALVGLLFLFPTNSFLSSSDTLITGEAVKTPTFLQKMESESTDEMEAESTDEFTTSALKASDLEQGNYYYIEVDGNSISVKMMRGTDDFSIAYSTVKQGIKDRNYLVTKSIKTTQLDAQNSYFAYYAGGEHFTMVES